MSLIQDSMVLRDLCADSIIHLIYRYSIDFTDVTMGFFRDYAIRSLNKYS